MLPGEEHGFGFHLRRQDNPQEEAVDSAEVEGTHGCSQLIYEIKIHQSLSHHNVVHLDHWFEDDTNQYIFMEYCPNGVLPL